MSRQELEIIRGNANEKCCENIFVAGDGIFTVGQQRFYPGPNKSLPIAIGFARQPGHAEPVPEAG